MNFNYGWPPYTIQRKFVGNPDFGRATTLCYQCIFGYLRGIIYFIICINVACKLLGSLEKVLDIYDFFPMCYYFKTVSGRGVFCPRFLRSYYEKYGNKTICMLLSLVIYFQWYIKFVLLLWDERDTPFVS